MRSRSPARARKSCCKLRSSLWKLQGRIGCRRHVQQSCLVRRCRPDQPLYCSVSSGGWDPHILDSFLSRQAYSSPWLETHIISAHGRQDVVSHNRDDENSTGMFLVGEVCGPRRTGQAAVSCFHVPSRTACGPMRRRVSGNPEDAWLAALDPVCFS